MKHRLLLCLSLIAGIIETRGQQQPIYTQYILNTFILNPALAGMENYWDVKTSFRSQWLGLKGAPTTAYLTINGPIGKDNGYSAETPTTVHAQDDNGLGGKEFWMEYTPPPASMGLGLTIVADKTGPFTKFAARASFAYHVPVGAKASLSMGVSGGAQEIYLDQSKLDFNGDGSIATDNAVAGSGLLNKLTPDVNAGLWLSATNFFLGLSAMQIFPLPLDYGTTKGDSARVIQGKLVPHFFFSAGYKVLINDQFSLLPSIMVSYVQPVPVGVDLNIKLQYLDAFWVGATYRYKAGFAGMLGLNLGSRINLGYSYDYTTTALNTVSHGTHELVLGFLIRRNEGIFSPRKSL